MSCDHRLEKRAPKDTPTRVCPSCDRFRGGNRSTPNQRSSDELANFTNLSTLEETYYMEVVAFAKEVAQNIAEHAASYRLGQAALRHFDRALWVVEKCARWAVPPPLEQDERPQPELVRPLPWPLFLAMLVTLRVAREAVSLANLLLGKPPLRSADVVMYIQSKRRYLRTLKYQGGRVIRARSAPPAREPWYSGFQSLFEFTMCFRRSQNYGNNNTTRISNNDEVLVVKRSKRPRDPSSPAASTSEATMERLIEKMMVDLDAESDDDFSLTLTNATSLRSDSGSENETVDNHDYTLTSSHTNDTAGEENNISTEKGNFTSSTPVKDSANPNTEESGSPVKGKTELCHVDSEENQDLTEEKPKTEDTVGSPAKHNSQEKGTSESEDGTAPPDKHKAELSQLNSEENVPHEETKKPKSEEPEVQHTKVQKNTSPKEDTQKFIQGERCSPQKGQHSPKSSRIANGRPMNAQNKRKGPQTQRRGESEIPGARPASADVL